MPNTFYFAYAAMLAAVYALDTQAKSFQKGGDSASARRIRERIVEIAREAYGPGIRHYAYVVPASEARPLYDCGN